MIAAASALLAVSACHPDPAAKAGVRTVTLRFATVDSKVNVNGQMTALTDFVSQVELRSHGQLRLQIVTSVGQGTPSSEVTLLKAIKRGTYDGGWNPTRAFAAAGFPAFEALEAPFVLQSYAAEQQAATGPVGRRMVARLHGSGLTGLGLVTGPLRRPFSVAHPLIRPTDWQGLTFRVSDSALQRATASVLGATPVDGGPHGGASLLESRKLGGQEFDTAQYDLDGFAGLEPYVTANLTLWPKTFALVMNPHRMSALTSQQRQWLRDAARQAANEPADQAFDETPAARRMCVTGVHFAYVTAPQLARLRAAVTPVYAMLRGNHRTAEDLTALQAIAAAHPTPSAPDVSAGCRGLAPPARLVQAHLTTRPRIPDGTYRVRMTAQDYERFGSEPGHAADNVGQATMTLRRGIYVLHVIFDGSQKSVLAEAGRLRGTKDTAVFSPDARLMRRLGYRCNDCEVPQSPYDFGFTYTRGRLTLTVGSGTTDPITLGTFAARPWLRIG
jgi:TRAP-type C4-dicarboxylate transport system substrate-binding protein